MMLFLSVLLLVPCILARPADLESDNDYVECYWCNSRDFYCGKRVTDTMVTILKCPKTHKCTVYTNPYDNYYLHRGCSFGLDFGEQIIENGCYIEEDGSTYCFCDYNRCNAAGILDLRNLAPELANSTTQSMAHILNDEEFSTKSQTTRKLYKTSGTIKHQTKSDIKQMEHLIRVPLPDTLTRIKNRQENDLLLKKIKEFSGGLPVGSSAITLSLTTPSTIAITTNASTPTRNAFISMLTTLKTPKVKFFTDKTRFNQYFSKIYQIEPTLTTSQLYSLPNFLKFKNQHKSKYPSIETTSITPSTTKSKTTHLTTITHTTTTTTTPKTKQQLNPKVLDNKLEEDYVVVETTNRPIFDWVRAYIEKYNSDNKQINFKCPNDGLYRHPLKCNQFLQCVYHGTFHERFYILDCPAGLHFNENLGYCDYSYNVNC